MNEQDRKKDQPQQVTQVGGDLIEAGNIDHSVVAIGEGASATVYNGDVHFHYHTAESEIAHLDIEPPLEDLLTIPAGPFLMGSDAYSTAEGPQHVVELPAYVIARYPVTNAEFARFLWDTGQVAGKALRWHGNEPPDDQLRHPVTGVTWYEALAYCRWLEEKSKRPYRLPDEAQWEKAARGTDGRLYPWGNDWQEEQCNTAEDLTAVDAFRPQSPYGCCDLVGNAREWTRSLWGSEMDTPDTRFAYPWKNDRRNDPEEPSTFWRVYRGGRYEEQTGYRCSARSAYLPDKPGPRSSPHGFRVVLLLPQDRT